MQKSYSYRPAIGMPGQIADSGFMHTLSLVAKEVTGLGRGVVQMEGVQDAARLPKVNYVEIQADADLIASNSTIVTISTTPLNGEATEYSTVAEVYATSHAATMAAIAVKVAALTGIATCTVGGDNGRTLQITADENYELTGASAATTAGASQASWTASYDTLDELLAVSELGYKFEQTGLNKGLLSRGTIVFDADLVASNVVTGYINGTLVTVTYATSHLNTMNLLKAAVEAVPGVQSASVGGTGNRTLSIVAIAGGWQLRFSPFTVTLGASQAGVTASATNPDDATAGLVEYQIGEMISGLQRGQIYVTVEEAVEPGDPVYLRFKASGTNTPGGFRKSADSSTAILVSGAKFMTAATAGGLAVLQINLP